jgi:hypothetical protein
MQSRIVCALFQRSFFCAGICEQWFHEVEAVCGAAVRHVLDGRDVEL